MNCTRGRPRFLFVCFLLCFAIKIIHACFTYIFPVTGDCYQVCLPMFTYPCMLQNLTCQNGRGGDFCCHSASNNDPKCFLNVRSISKLPASESYQSFYFASSTSAYIFCSPFLGNTDEIKQISSLYQKDLIFQLSLPNIATDISMQNLHQTHTCIQERELHSTEQIGEYRQHLEIAYN